jgi:amino acid permease
MSTKNNTRRKVAVSLGIVFCLFPLFYQVLWIYIFGLYNNHADRVGRFITYLPPLCKEPRPATWVFLASSVVAFVLLAAGLKLQQKIARTLVVLSLILTGIMILFLLFSLM